MVWVACGEEEREIPGENLTVVLITNRVSSTSLPVGHKTGNEFTSRKWDNGV